jgi:hypothetical protein
MAAYAEIHSMGAFMVWGREHTRAGFQSAGDGEEGIYGTSSYEQSGQAIDSGVCIWKPALVATGMACLLVIFWRQGDEDLILAYYEHCFWGDGGQGHIDQQLPYRKGMWCFVSFFSSMDSKVSWLEKNDSQSKVSSYVVQTFV